MGGVRGASECMIARMERRFGVADRADGQKWQFCCEKGGQKIMHYTPITNY